MKGALPSVIAILLSLGSEVSHALTLPEFLDQVRSTHNGLTGAKKQADAANDKMAEANLLFRPSLFAQGTTAADGKQSNPAMLRYDRVEADKYSLGLAQQFSFGLQGKLYYQFARTEYVNSSLPGLGAPEDYYDVNPTLELSMPLWGNGFGRTNRAQQSLIIFGNKAEEYASKAQLTVYEIEAENAYWSLVAKREIVKTQERALSSAEGILSYVRKKSGMRLGEDSDVLQAEALVAARKLELRKSISEEHAARKNFNAQRNLVSDEIPETLDPIPYLELSKLPPPAKRPSDRYDVLAAEAQTEAAVANAKLVEERNKPTFDVFGSYAFNGRSYNSASDANSHVYGGDRGSQVIGIRLNVPLDLASSSRARSGARLSEIAQREQYSYKQLAQEKDWALLGQMLQDSKESLELADKLVVAQKAKLNKEKVRFRQGRATTYQVLLFEQDQSQAEVIRTQIAAQLLTLRSGIKAYETSSAGKEQ
ncbi:MAG: TolC family protein [Bdellovibrionaceae bacterium]|nr:TolC family protein [Pseudobdellovibrionaceae bacterium]